MFAASKTDGVSGGYQISRSLRFNSADSAYLNRTLTTPTDNKKFTLSMWVKKSGFTGFNADNYILAVNSSSGIYFTDPNILYFQNGGGTATTTAVFRDPSSWYHLVFVFDSANATTNDRMIIYVNNVRQALTTNTPPSLNATGSINSATNHDLGRYISGLYYLNGYMTEVNFIDGQALTPSSFGETNAQTGVWQPKAYSGSYGTNGFYLNFSDNSNTTAATLGKDYSGNGNNWTPNNFSVTAGAGNDSLIDSPTAYGFDTGVGGTVRGNYATLNPLDKGPNVTITNGNLSTTNNYVGPPFECSRATIGVSSGKWYWEVTATTVSGNSPSVGVASASASITNYLGSDTQGWGYLLATGQKANNATFTSYGATVANGDIVGVALDMDAGTLTFYKNGTSQGQAFSSLSGILFPTIFSFNTSVLELNFGQRPFAYTAPSGYKALCTQNLPTPTIGATSTTLATKYFNPVTFTSPSGGASVSGVGFQPDFTWEKSRSAAESNALFNVLQGNNAYLISNSTAAEGSFTNVWVPNSDGFTIANGVLSSGQTYVSWNWKANGSGSTNTAGSITSTVSANTTSGFSVVTYAGNSTLGATVGHGLGVAPSMIIVKSRSAATNWPVYHTSIGNTKALFLNLTNATDTDNYWNNTSPTSTVFSLNASTGLNSSGSNYVAYCFAEVAGYSKFGSYTGNGSADGVFVYTGFRPKYIMIHQSSGTGGHWSVKDTARSPSNVALANLFPNLSNAETSEYDYDILSNGFKLRTTSITVNASAETYIFAAFAESPFKYSLAR